MALFIWIWCLCYSLGKNYCPCSVTCWCWRSSFRKTLVRFNMTVQSSVPHHQTDSSGPKHERLSYGLTTLKLKALPLSSVLISCMHRILKLSHIKYFPHNGRLVWGRGLQTCLIAPFDQLFKIKKSPYWSIFTYETCLLVLIELAQNKIYANLVKFPDRILLRSFAQGFLITIKQVHHRPSYGLIRFEMSVNFFSTSWQPFSVFLSRTEQCFRLSLSCCK